MVVASCVSEGGGGLRPHCTLKNVVDNLKLSPYEYSVSLV